MATAKDLERALKNIADPKAAAFQSRYFKTGKGEYGEGDKFLGIKLPPQRRIAREFEHLPLGEVLKVLKSPWHECRLTAAIILVSQYRQGDAAQREKIFRAYLKHREFLNNWDLIDSSAHIIVGGHLFERDLALLEKLAKSPHWNERRIAVIASAFFIVRHQFQPTLTLAAGLLDDPHDLIHKAVGWMLREIGKRNEAVLHKFLRQHASRMPRTMLRYAIEKFSVEDRKKYLKIPRATKILKRKRLRRVRSDCNRTDSGD